ncbi:HNH endonuclease [Photobacterium leiognathi]|uniref:HNH endonuclease n=1 Tax=Photobacterium leiognathi TaxID=553611 RepID=UPI002980C38E|nr:HNH endonuclease [Photobacterium leiognathi]
MSHEQDFEIYIMEQHRISKEETGYKAPLFRSMVSERGALQTARDLLVGPNKISEGLTRLVLHNRLDLSLEASVIKPEWRGLFTIDELGTAVRRLRELKYPIDSDIEDYLKQEIKPKRKSYETNKIIREQGLPLKVKELYEYKCQMCGIRLEAGDYWYAEAAHIRALGEPHNGLDTIENILCLCPNHHKLFDIGGIYVENDLTVPQLGKRLHKSEEHNLDIASIEYHRQWCKQN